MSSDLIQKMFEYNLWANTQMLALCCGLTDEQLEIEVEGVFGRIQSTLTHLIRAEGGYLKHMTGSRPWADDLDWDALSMRDLLENVQISSQQLLDIANKVDPHTQHFFQRGDEKLNFYNWTVLLQVLYHGIEHRTQVKILLTQLGVEHPELASWDFMDSLRGSRG